MVSRILLIVALHFVGSAYASCVDTGVLGDGWGWDGSSSCRVSTTSNTCMDTDPVGDGWGWDGSTSCRVSTTSNTCMDTDPVGDGWGWDGSTSCRVSNTSVACIDTDPVGDGWGWDGSTSCTVSKSALAAAVRPQSEPEIGAALASGGNRFTDLVWSCLADLSNNIDLDLLIEYSQLIFHGDGQLSYTGLVGGDNPETVSIAGSWNLDGNTLSINTSRSNDYEVDFGEPMILALNQSEFFSCNSRTN